MHTSDEVQLSFDEAIAMAEREFAATDFAKFEKSLKESGWSLDYIYLDGKKNRYRCEAELIEKVELSQIVQEKDL